MATATGSYAAGHVLALAGGTKWSAATGTPVTDIRAAADVIRKKIGKRPNHLTLSADALVAITMNTEVKGYLASTQMGPATIDQLKTILNVATIEVGDAVWIDETDTDGKAITGTAADHCGRALGAATQAGQLIEVQLYKHVHA